MFQVRERHNAFQVLTSQNKLLLSVDDADFATHQRLQLTWKPNRMTAFFGRS